MSDPSTENASFWEHADALRTTLIRIVVTVAVSALCAFAVYPYCFDVLTWPLQQVDSQHGVVEESILWKRVTNHEDTEQTVVLDDGKETKVRLQPGESIDYSLPQNHQTLVLFGPLDGMLLTLKVSLWAGLACSSPLWMYWIFAFAAPGLEKREKRILLPFLVLSALFFFAGAAFCMLVTLPIANAILFGFNSSLGVNLWSLSTYVQYSSLLILAHGIAFEAIVVLLFLVQFELVTAHKLAQSRKLVVVGVLTLSAILTPPDVITQCLLAAPLLVAYEALILFARWKSWAGGRLKKNGPSAEVPH